VTTRIQAEPIGIPLPRTERLVIAPSIGAMSGEVDLAVLQGAVALRSAHADVEGLGESLRVIAHWNDISRVDVFVPDKPHYDGTDSHGSEFLSKQLAAVRRHVGYDLHVEVSGRVIRTDTPHVDRGRAHQVLVVSAPPTVSYGAQMHVINEGRVDGMRVVDAQNTSWLHALHLSDIERDIGELLRPASAGGRVGIQDVRVPVDTRYEHPEAGTGLVASVAEQAGAKVELRDVPVLDLERIGREIPQLKVPVAETIPEGTVVVTKMPTEGRLRTRLR
jgi:hypothetical protein